MVSSQSTVGGGGILNLPQTFTNQGASLQSWTAVGDGVVKVTCAGGYGGGGSKYGYLTAFLPVKSGTILKIAVSTDGQSSSGSGGGGASAVGIDSIGKWVILAGGGGGSGTGGSGGAGGIGGVDQGNGVGAGLPAGLGGTYTGGGNPGNQSGSGSYAGPGVQYNGGGGGGGNNNGGFGGYLPRLNDTVSDMYLGPRGGSNATPNSGAGGAGYWGGAGGNKNSGAGGGGGSSWVDPLKGLLQTAEDPGVANRVIFTSVGGFIPVDITFTYTGSSQTWTATSTRVVTLIVCGANGGDTWKGPGGAGGYVTIDVWVIAGTSYQIWAGQRGSDGGYGSSGSGRNGAGGGGASGFGYTGTGNQGWWIVAGGGGGSGTGNNSAYIAGGNGGVPTTWNGGNGTFINSAYGSGATTSQVGISYGTRNVGSSGNGFRGGNGWNGGAGGAGGVGVGSGGGGGDWSGDQGGGGGGGGWFGGGGSGTDSQFGDSGGGGGGSTYYDSNYCIGSTVQATARTAVSGNGWVRILGN